MPKKALQQQLTELHEELATAAELDPELRHLLREVAGDIENVLDETAEQDRIDEDLLGRVRQATVDFEAEHPRLAQILSELTDALAKLGI